ncbi:G-protein coupled receptor 55-like [Hyperolius riggenbachi]|uniref:G-protein coupled receptor 55-like n=1 Tax=Hyperolius riggenbachi TaxID=752182 RepID=UPI0035A31D75
MTNSTGVDPSVQLFQLILYIPTFIFGLIFNTLAMWMLFFRIKKWMEATVYMAALIVFDSLLLITLPFKIRAYYVGDGWKLGFGVCTFLESLYFVNVYGSLLTSVCICVDRYIAIQYPFYSKVLRSPMKATVVCVLVCIVVWGASIGFFIRLREAAATHCFYGFSSRTWSSKSLVIIIETAFLFSAALLIVCTTLTIRTLKKKARANLSNPTEMKAIKVLVANMVTFIVSFLPFHVSLLLYHLVKNNFISQDYANPLRIFIQVSLCLSNINCFLDGVCYYCILKEFVKSTNKSPE